MRKVGLEKSQKSSKKAKRKSFSFSLNKNPFDGVRGSVLFSFGREGLGVVTSTTAGKVKQKEGQLIVNQREIMENVRI